MTSDTIKHNVAEVRAIMGADAKRIGEEGRTAMQKHLAPKVYPGVKRDMILVERVTDGEKCGVGGNRCPGLPSMSEYCIIFREPVNGCGKPYAIRCPACLATPSAVVLTTEMIEAVKYLSQPMFESIHAVINNWEQHRNAIDTLSAAFQQIEGVGK